MKVHTKTASLLALGALLVTSSSAFAEEGRDYLGQKIDRPAMATSTARMSSSTEMRNKESEMKEAGRRTVPGIVTQLTPNGFLMSARGRGDNRVSTPFTVVITSSTVFKTAKPGERIMMATSTMRTSASTTPLAAASLSDLKVGSKVEVFGVLATSTRTITAERIHINRDGMNKGQEMKDSKKPSFSDKLRGLFGKKATTSEATINSGPAAIGASEFVSALMDVLFGWLRK